jgi:CRISPR-associated protein Csb2
VETLRDRAAGRLLAHWPKADIDRCIFGYNAKEADKALRIRIIPLPSTGATSADQAIRRILVESPPDCPIACDDMAWAFSGLDLSWAAEFDKTDQSSGHILVKSADRKMLRQYGIESETKMRVWRTVTPASLAIDQRPGQIKSISGSERVINQQLLAHAVKQALRHAGVHTKAEIRKIQREPLDQQGLSADEFAYGRFSGKSLFHLEIAFEQPLAGPILVGNGRYFGLGLMRPVEDMHEDVLVLEISAKNRPKVTERSQFLTAVRRALLACARDYQGAPSRLFSGHEVDGAPARSGQHDHVFLAADDSDGDGFLDHLLLVAPWRADRTHHAQQEAPAAFTQITAQLEFIRAGRLGVFQLTKSLHSLAAERLLPLSQHWRSTTLYEPTRYPKSMADAQEKLQTDVLLECQRRGLPEPSVEIISITAGKRGRYQAEARLSFAVAVAGPLMLGRESHKGGGLFFAEN